MIQEMIPGTYILFASHEFGKEFTRGWSYEKVNLKHNYQFVPVTGIYFPVGKILEVIGSGDLQISYPK